MTYEGIGGIGKVSTAAVYAGVVKHDTAPSGSSANKFDSIFISAKRNGSDAVQREWVSRISQEVRTAMSTGEIRRLQSQVADGTYVPDPMAIAGRLLLLPEG